jgi:hypothetical protein
MNATIRKVSDVQRPAHFKSGWSGFQVEVEWLSKRTSWVAMDSLSTDLILDARLLAMGKYGLSTTGIVLRGDARMRMSVEPLDDCDPLAACVDATVSSEHLHTSTEVAAAIGLTLASQSETAAAKVVSNVVHGAVSETVAAAVPPVMPCSHIGPKATLPRLRVRASRYRPSAIDTPLPPAPAASDASDAADDGHLHTSSEVAAAIGVTIVSQPTAAELPDALRDMLNTRRPPSVEVVIQPVSLGSRFYHMCASGQLGEVSNLDSYFEQPANLELLLLVGGQLWAGLMLRPTASSDGMLYILFSYSHSSHRRLGLQRLLVNQAISHFKPSRIIRQANVAHKEDRVAINRRIGFEVVESCVCCANLLCARCFVQSPAGEAIQKHMPELCVVMERRCSILDAV